jgi:chemotaxis protein MotB
MARKRRKKLYKDKADRWLLTYADLITLLLAFFIVMYSMSRIDAKKFGEVSQELQSVLKGGNNAVLKYLEKQTSDGHGLLKLGSLKMLQQQIDKKFEQLSRPDIIQTEITERGLVVHIMETTLFSEGSARLRNPALDALDLIYDQIKDVSNHIRIEGHTDDRPIKNKEFESNWKLSVARATSVVKYFIENHNFPAEKISALGYGEFRPRVPNTSIENRALNRRVDVVVLTDELSLKEPSSAMYDTSG